MIWFIETYKDELFLVRCIKNLDDNKEFYDTKEF